ncbi:hypothetical protein Pelo_18002 [Pelomyxa schiedti]|nr:hypothetical protein Pelo_18002 [Pelomyxa schiedti]
MWSEALCELSTAFKVATKLRSQLQKAAPLLVSLEHSVSVLKQFLESATERNLSLEVHLKDLSTLRKELEKAVDESDSRCKQVLGQTLTVESSESEIQQCSRTLSSLMKKLLEIKTLSSLSGNTEEKERGTRALMHPYRHQQLDGSQTMVAELSGTSSTLLFLHLCPFKLAVERDHN